MSYDQKYSQRVGGNAGINMNIHKYKEKRQLKYNQNQMLTVDDDDQPRSQKGPRVGVNGQPVSDDNLFARANQNRKELNKSHEYNNKKLPANSGAQIQNNYIQDGPGQVHLSRKLQNASNNNKKR